MSFIHVARFFGSTVLIFSALLIAGCGGGDGSGIVMSPPPLAFPPSQPPSESPVASFAEIQAGILGPDCATSGCHLGAGAPQGLRLDDVNSYALLVGIASSEVPGILRVAPGDPDGSYLIQKLEGTASVGAQMPLNGTPLSQSVIDVIRQWIIDGAIDDRAPSADPIRVTGLTPMPGSDGTAPADPSTAASGSPVRGQCVGGRR